MPSFAPMLVRNHLQALVLASLWSVFCPAALGQAEPGATEYRALVDQYCVACHNSQFNNAGVILEGLDMSALSQDAEVWERVMRKLRSRAMPPPGSPRPDEAVYQVMIGWMQQQIDTAARVAPNPGRTETFHRLNRYEYKAAIEDLLAISVDVEEILPGDNTFDAGFDNNGAMLSVSPVLLERYLLAARKISRLAVGIAPATPSIDNYKVPLNLIQDERTDPRLPFGSRGGTVVEHYFPVDGRYRVKVDLQTQYNDYLRGMGRKHTLDIRLNGALLQRFQVGGEAPGMASPEGYAGNIMMDPEWEDYMHHADDKLFVEFEAKAGPQQLTVSFVRNLVEEPGILQPRQTSYALATEQRYFGNAAVDLVTITGPLETYQPGNTPSRRRIFSCQPAESSDARACARDILADLATTAYRRPVTDSELDTLLTFYGEGEDFESGIQRAIERLLVDPNFLFRIEHDPAGILPDATYAVSDIELASRLSFFLWSTIPDAELLETAIAGRLSEPSELTRQVERLLHDPRAADSLVRNFAAQWLQLRNLKTHLPDPEIFPEFDENLREAFLRETELFIAHTIENDASVIELLDANYTFVNERLARHYGIDGIYGPHFRRVEFAAGDIRGGLLGQGSLLTVTSYANRTSPVLRGKWLLQNIVGSPPPEPPPNVPALPDSGKQGQPASVRERLEEHRRNPVCASCHAPMDPLGFALENFDAIGSWRRISEGGSVIDASGILPNGIKFEGVVGLHDHLVSDAPLFAETVTEKLLAFALGRGLQYFDRPTIRQIVRDAAPEDYRWSALVKGIVLSPAFQMRRADSADAGLSVAEESL
jgi:mono/diheme cytochrome c family protein